MWISFSPSRRFVPHRVSAVVLKRVVDFSPLTEAISLGTGFCATWQCALWRFGQSLLPCDRREYEKCAPDCAEQQTHNPKPAFPCKGGNCSDGNRDLEHRHAAGEYFVLVKV